MDSRRVGTVAESEVVSSLIRDGAVVSEPLHYEARYDLIADYNGDLHRIQVKCAYETNSDKQSVRVEARSKNKDGEAEYTSDEVDVFCVYVPSKDQVYWFWFEEVGSQFNIFTGDWDDLNPANKSRIRNPVEYEISEREK